MQCTGSYSKILALKLPAFSVALLLYMLFCPNSAIGSSLCRPEAIPGLKRWERQMIDRGHYWGRFFDPSNDVPIDRKQTNEFYDSAYVFFQIADYTGENEPWLTYAGWAQRVYVGHYLARANWRAAGWRRSSHGIFENYLRHGGLGVNELELIRDRPAFSRIREGRGRGGSERLSREIALAVQAHVHAERAGAPRKMEENIEQLSVFVPWMGSHLYEWRTGDFRGNWEQGQSRFAPFMFGITAHALIEFVEWERQNERNPNLYWPDNFPIDYGSGVSEGVDRITWAGIEGALKDVAKWAVLEAKHESGERMWVNSRRRETGFLYESIKSPKTAFDLNLMIAHVYGWLWKETGDPFYREVGDRLFETGAYFGATGTGKHFNQQYRMAFDYVKWRELGDKIHCDKAHE